jgi:O-antigen/teichoic acid export membrane protein
MNGLLRRTQGPIARGTIRTSLVLGLRLLVQAGTLLLVARMLGPHQFGAFAGVAALAVILGTLASFGTTVVLLGEVSKDPARRSAVLPYAIPCTLLCGVALLSIYLAVATLALADADVPLPVLTAIGITEMLLQPLLTLASSEHLGLGRIARSQLLVILPLALRLGAAITVFVLASANPLTAYGYGYFAASLIALAIAMATLPTRWPAIGSWRLPRSAEVRNAAGYAVLNITATSPAELDKTLATRLLPLAASGLYAAGARVVGATMLPIGAMMLSALPRLFREGHDRLGHTARLLRWIFAAALCYSIVLAAVLWLAAPIFVWVFGAKYHGIEHVIHWLTLAVPGMAIRMAAGSVVMALGKPWVRAGFELAGLVVLVVAAGSLVPRVGAVGMPLALACSEWSMAILGSVITIGALNSLQAAPRRAP